MDGVRKLIIYKTHEMHVVQVAAHRGEELFRFLTTQGIDGTIVKTSQSLFDSIELDEDVNTGYVYGILSQWQ